MAVQGLVAVHAVALVASSTQLSPSLISSFQSIPAFFLLNFRTLALLFHIPMRNILDLSLGS